MKKNFMVAVLLSCIFIIASQVANAQWNYTGGNETFVGGNVGIGTASPTFLVHVQNGAYDGTNEGWGTCIAGGGTLPFAGVGTLSVSSRSIGNIGVAGISRHDNSTNMGGYFHSDGSWTDGDSCAGNMGAFGYATGDGLSSGQADWIFNCGIDGESHGNNANNVGGNFWVENSECSGLSVGIVTGASGGQEAIIGIYADVYNPDSCAVTDSVMTNSGLQPTVFAAYFNGNTFTSGSPFTASDLRMKKDIKQVKNASDILSKINARTYTFNQEKFPGIQFAKGMHYGVVAQEVEKVLPTLVMNTKTVSPPRKGMRKTSYDIKAVNYTEFIPILIAAHNEMKEDLESKNREIENLKSEMKELKNMVNDICNYGCGGLRGDNSSGPAPIAVLYQSVPNPASGSATIGYMISSPFENAAISITTIDGKPVKEFPISSSGKGSVVFDASGSSDTDYKYSLIVDGKLYDTKSMVISKN